jgi:proteic killer suppression protein
VNVRHASAELKRVEADATYTGGYPESAVTAFRKRMQYIRSAKSEQDLRVWKSLHYEKLKGKRKHQRSMRLNDQWRLVLEFENTVNGPQVIVVAIEDYH